jgi:hypothetical protein
VLPYSPAELQREADLARSWFDLEDDAAWDAWSAEHPDVALIADIVQIAGMVVYLGPFRENPIERQIGDDEGKFWHFYTCRNFDGHNCRIYDSRPAMCSEYPYGRACTYAACTRRAHPTEGPRLDMIGGGSTEGERYSINTTSSSETQSRSVVPSSER